MTGSEKEKTKTLRIRVYGIVQGVGFRPTVSRHAMEAGIRGSVCNKGPYVEIIAQGTDMQCGTFLKLLKEAPPIRASIIRTDVEELNGKEHGSGTDTEKEPAVYEDFSIIESGRTKGEIYISPDIAICEDCRKELYDPEDRRYLHPFINCTNCGPRMTILEGLPYDRERTSMKEFPMCGKCFQEYHDPETRRYDAQPVCCNDCGPEVYILGPDGPGLRGREAITCARKIIMEGGIVAIKGIGGFHLSCDALNGEAVKRLRRLKNRPAKPFAVMMKDIETVERECIIGPDIIRELITGHQKPIILLEKREDTAGKETSAFKPGISEETAPGNPKLGVMLPYAPLQMLLFDYDDGISMTDCLVMTSANESGAPICRDDNDALKELLPLCDAILSHNRLIRIRADDTVMDMFEDEPYMIRRSRGYAPLPVLFESAPEVHKEGIPSVIGIGGELKNSFCIGRGQLFYPSPYVGDLGDVRTLNALDETIGRFCSLLEAKPEAIACDMHPLYRSRELAYELKKRWEEKGYDAGSFGNYRAAADDISSVGGSDICAAERDGHTDNNIYNSNGHQGGGSGIRAGTKGGPWQEPRGSGGEDGSQQRPENAGEIRIQGSDKYRQKDSREDGQTGLQKNREEGKEDLQEIKIFELQHHYAHILSCMAENGRELPVIGASFDGTGYGTDGTIWGGEILFSTWDGFERLGHIDGFKQAGGDMSAKEGWRIAASMINGLYGKEKGMDMCLRLGLCSKDEYLVISAMSDRMINTVPSTSAGRLFDAVSAVLGIKKASSFEGEASTALMYAAMEGAKEFDVKAYFNRRSRGRSECLDIDTLHAAGEGGIILNTNGLMEAVLRERLKGTDIKRTALNFHLALSEMTADAVAAAAEIKPEACRTAALSGGVFQNTLLLGYVKNELERCGMNVLIHHLIPPNDGGIALGQAVYAMKHL